MRNKRRIRKKKLNDLNEKKFRNEFKNESKQRGFEMCSNLKP